MKRYIIVASLLLAWPATAQTVAPPTRLEQIQVFTEDLAKRETSIRAKSDQIIGLWKNFSISAPPAPRIESLQEHEVGALEAVADKFFGHHVAVAPPPDTQASVIAKATGPAQGDETIADHESKIRYRLAWHRQREIKVGLQHLHEELDAESAKAKAAAAAATVAK